MRRLLPSSKYWEYTIQTPNGPSSSLPEEEVLTKRSIFRRSTVAIRISAQCGFSPLVVELGDTPGTAVKPIMFDCTW